MSDRPPLAIGDIVTTAFNRGEEQVIRRITKVEKTPRSQSGWCASADAGESCKCCGRPRGKDIPFVDCDWFKRVGETTMPVGQ